jgi:hypothetical protein
MAREHVILLCLQRTRCFSVANPPERAQVTSRVQPVESNGYTAHRSRSLDVPHEEAGKGRRSL